MFSLREQIEDMNSEADVQTCREAIRHRIDRVSSEFDDAIAKKDSESIRSRGTSLLYLLKVMLMVMMLVMLMVMMMLCVCCLLMTCMFYYDV